jgi:hypothetical protein
MQLTGKYLLQAMQHLSRGEGAPSNLADGRAPSIGRRLAQGTRQHRAGQQVEHHLTKSDVIAKLADGIRVWSLDLLVTAGRVKRGWPPKSYRMLQPRRFAERRRLLLYMWCYRWLCMTPIDAVVTTSGMEYYSVR